MEETRLTVFETGEWIDLRKHEEVVGADRVFEEIMGQDQWSNAQMMWMLRYMLLYYGSRDPLLKKAPIERIMGNMDCLIRVFYLILDHMNPDLDENTRLYATTKLKEATWGLDEKTRYYLTKSRS